MPYYPYNGTTTTGGDSLHDDLNIFYQSGDIAWMLTSTALVRLPSHHLVSMPLTYNSRSCS